MKNRSSRFRLPPVATNARPGSDEKVRVLAERVRLGVGLWHPLDARLPTASQLNARDDRPAQMCLAS